jgi:drug/metabolite transporter (DMT)-like permease
MIGAASVLAWVMLIGFVLALPAAAVSLDATPVAGATFWWLLVSGAGNLVGLLSEYAGLRIGKVGIVAPIASTEGAIAAVIAGVAGERIAPGAGVVLGVIAVGVVLAGIAPGDPEGSEGSRRGGRATVYAVVAAVTFGVSLYAAGRVSRDVPLGIIVLPARLMGVVVLAAPLAVTRKLRLTRRALPLVLVSGICEIGGLASFSVGARHGIAVSAVLGSQFAALAALAAFVLFRERLGRIQLAGVAAIVAGVSLLTAIRA